MKCPECKTDDLLYAKVTVTLDAPLVKGGGVNLAGLGVTQAQVKEAWTKEDVRGPISCVGCGSEFQYFVGLTPALRLADKTKDADEGAEDAPEEDKSE
jgi:hypothetical protein